MYSAGRVLASGLSYRLLLYSPRLKWHAKCKPSTLQHLRASTSADFVRSMPVLFRSKLLGHKHVGHCLDASV